MYITRQYLALHHSCCICPAVIVSSGPNMSVWTPGIWKPWSGEFHLIPLVFPRSNCGFHMVQPLSLSLTHLFAFPMQSGIRIIQRKVIHQLICARITARSTFPAVQWEDVVVASKSYGAIVASWTRPRRIPRGNPRTIHEFMGIGMGKYREIIELRELPTSNVWLPEDNHTIYSQMTVGSNPGDCYAALEERNHSKGCALMHHGHMYLENIGCHTFSHRHYLSYGHVPWK